MVEEDPDNDIICQECDDTMIKEDYMYYGTAFQGDELKAKKNCNGDLVIFNNTVPDKDTAHLSKEQVKYLKEWLELAFPDTD